MVDRTLDVLEAVTCLVWWRCVCMNLSISNCAPALTEKSNNDSCRVFGLWHRMTAVGRVAARQLPNSGMTGSGMSRPSRGGIETAIAGREPPIGIAEPDRPLLSMHRRNRPPAPDGPLSPQKRTLTRRLEADTHLQAFSVALRRDRCDDQPRDRFRMRASPIFEWTSSLR